MEKVKYQKIVKKIEKREELTCNSDQRRCRAWKVTEYLTFLGRGINKCKDTPKATV